jgi:hypothetical protein
VVYDEPGADGTNVRVSITRAEAIRRAKIVAAAHGKRFASDEDALGEFLTVHWGWIEKRTPL